MPYLKIQTNQPLSDEEQQALCEICSAVVAEQLGKSEQYVMVIVQSDQTMNFAGDTQTCAYLELKSLGLQPEQTPVLSATLCDLMQKNLGVDPQRTYIEFSASPRTMWGWNSKTF